MWFAVLIVLVCQDLESSRSSLAASSRLFPESWQCACLPSTPSPGFSSPTQRLPLPRPLMSSQARLQMVPAESPLVDAHTVVCRINKHGPSPALGTLALSGCPIACAHGYPSPYSQAYMASLGLTACWQGLGPSGQSPCFPLPARPGQATPTARPPRSLPRTCFAW